MTGGVRAALRAALLASSAAILGGACGKGASSARSAGDSVRGPSAEAQPPAARHDERVFAGGVAPTGVASVNPFGAAAGSAADGEKLFNAMNCDGCHGGGATGWVGPSLNTRRFHHGGGDAELFESIYGGRPSGMPAFGGILSRDAIWKIVTYIKSLPPPATLPTRSW